MSRIMYNPEIKAYSQKRIKELNQALPSNLNKYQLGDIKHPVKQFNSLKRQIINHYSHQQKKLSQQQWKIGKVINSDKHLKKSKNKKFLLKADYHRYYSNLHHYYHNPKRYGKSIKYLNQQENKLYQKFDFQYLNHICDRNADFRMISTRLYAPNIYSVTSPPFNVKHMPYKFNQHNMEITPQEEKKFIKEEQRQVQRHKRHNQINIKGSTLAKQHLSSLAYHPNKHGTYTVNRWLYEKAQYDVKHPQGVIRFAKSLAQNYPDTALTVSQQGTKYTPQMHNDVKYMIAKNHFLPTQTIVDTYESRNQQASKNYHKVRYSGNNWVHLSYSKKKNQYFIESPDSKAVQNTITQIQKKYQRQLRYQIHPNHQQMQNILNKVGLGTPDQSNTFDHSKQFNQRQSTQNARKIKYHSNNKQQIPHIKRVKSNYQI